MAFAGKCLCEKHQAKKREQQAVETTKPFIKQVQNP
jgi:hypothetical protein